jgi:hypothetical protein
MGTTPNRAIPYPEPSDLVTNGAAAMQALAEGVDDAMGAPLGFASYLPANKAVANAVWTTLNGLTEVTDRGGNLDPAAGVYTVPVAGLWLFTANAFWQSSTVGARYLALWRATSVSVFFEIPGTAQTAPSGLDPRMQASAVLHCNAGDRIKVQAFHTAGANLNVIGTVDYGADNAARFGGALLVAD